jgi:uncharacterized OB-fold protein
MPTRETSPRYLPEEWILPAITDENRAFFTSGEVKVQRCAACGWVQHPPEEVCRMCHAMEFEYISAQPTGTVESFSIVHYAVHPMLKAATPYNVAVVALDEYPDVHIVGNIVGVAPADVSVGMKVTATFAPVEAHDGSGETLQLLQWKAAL